MGDVLGKKQRIQNSDWIDTFGKIEQLVTKKELDQLIEKTVKEIKKKTKGKKTAYAWSGGQNCWEGVREKLGQIRWKSYRKKRRQTAPGCEKYTDKRRPQRT